MTNSQEEWFLDFERWADDQPELDWEVERESSPMLIRVTEGSCEIVVAIDNEGVVTDYHSDSWNVFEWALFEDIEQI